MNRKKAKTVPPAKAQKTIVDFFKPQSSEPSVAVLKIKCPACSLDVPESKINWHLDQDCKSREKPKRKKDGNLVKRKKILKSVKTEIASKKKQRIMLSDDEEEDLYKSDASEDIEIIGSKGFDDEVPYIAPSMVETHIFEIDEISSSKVPECRSSFPLSVEKTDESDSSDLSPIKKEITSPVEYRDIELKAEISSPQRRLASLQLDWESPLLSPSKPVIGTESSPGKENRSANISSQGLETMVDFNSESSSTPSKLSLNKRRATKEVLDGNLDEIDVSRSTYVATPHNHANESSKISRHQLEGKLKSVCSKSSGAPVTESDKLDSGSDDDFEKPIQFRTPEKLAKKRFKSIGSGKKKESGIISSSLPCDSLSPLSGPAGSEIIEKYLTPLISPSLVSPVGSPSSSKSNSSCAPIMGDNKTEYVRKLFPSGTSEGCQGSIDRAEASTSKVHLSPNIKSSANRFSKIDKDSLFDALLNAASQSQEDRDISQSQSSSGITHQSQGERSNRIFVQTPRKINQSIKSTGILQSSPQNVSKNVLVRRRSSSLSPQKQNVSPSKQFGTFQSSPSVSEVFAENKYDKAIFRGHKGYYLENFLLIITTVMSEPDDMRLFDEEDHSILKSFHKLSLQAQKLYVRLFQRKIKWNRVSKLDYRDICDQEDMELYVKELSYANFLQLEVDLCDPGEVLQLLSAEELKNLCKKIKISAVGKKEDLISSLLKFNQSQPSLFSAFSKSSSKNSIILKQAKEYLGQCCIVNKDVHRVFMRVIMLYGLPRYDDDDDKGNHTQLTTLLMVNLGKMSFPKYDIVRQHSIFQSRDELIRFEGCSQILTDLHDCLEKQQWEESLQYCDLAKATYQELINNGQLLEHDLSLPSFLRCYTSISILVHILSCSVECYQRLKNYRKAVEQLRFLLDQSSHLQDYRGRWYDRLALNLEVYLKSPSATLEVIKEALNDPEVREGHRLSLSIRAERMAASKRFKSHVPDILKLPLMKPREAPKIVIEGRSLPGEAGYKKVFIRQDSDRHAGEGEVTVCSVEELVLNYYKSQGYTEGLHREGTTVNSLFGLLFWDIIYDSVPDVFRSPHQAAPLDLNDQHFYTARKELIENRLSELKNFTEEETGKELERIWNEHIGKTAVVAWDIFRNLEYVKGLVLSLKLPILASICRRLAVDHRFTRSGFPDLIVWNPVDKKCCIVEVKGPNDRLSTKQILWLDYLLEHGAVAEVCHVEAIGAKKMKLASPRRILPKKKTPFKVNSAEGDVKSKKSKGRKSIKKAKVREEQEAQNSKSVVSKPCKIDDDDEDSFQTSTKRLKRARVDQGEECSKVSKETSMKKGGEKPQRKQTRNTKADDGIKYKDETMLKPSEKESSGEGDPSKLRKNALRDSSVKVNETSLKVPKTEKNKSAISNVSKTARKRQSADVEEDESVNPPKKQRKNNSKEKVIVKFGNGESKVDNIEENKSLESNENLSLQGEKEDKKCLKITRKLRNNSQSIDSKNMEVPRRSRRNQ